MKCIFFFIGTDSSDRGLNMGCIVVRVFKCEGALTGVLVVFIMDDKVLRVINLEFSQLLISN